MLAYVLLTLYAVMLVVAYQSADFMDDNSDTP